MWLERVWGLHVFGINKVLLATMLRSKTLVGTKLIAATPALHIISTRRRMVSVAVATQAAPHNVGGQFFQSGTPARQPAVKASQPQALTSLQNYHDDIAYILYSEDQLKARVAVLGHQLSVDYADRAPLILGVGLRLLLVLRSVRLFFIVGDLKAAWHPCMHAAAADSPIDLQA